MRHLSVILLLILCLTVLIVCGGCASKTYITFGEAGVLTAQVETTIEGTVRVPIPAGADAAQCIGWRAKSGEDTLFLPIGSTYTYGAGEVKDFTPVYIRFTTNKTATPILTETDVGICFTAAINKADWELLSTVSQSTTRGMLILPKAEALTLGTITHATLQEAGKTAVDIPSTTWLTTSKDLAYGATLTDIPTFLRTTDYTAVGYIKITYTDQSETYIYADYESNTQPAASLMALANAALIDLSETKTDTYQHPVDEQFSPYTDAERATLQALTKFPVYLVVDETIKGNRRLHDDYLAMYTERLVYFADDSNAGNNFSYTEEARAIYRALKDNIYSGGGALVIASKDGTPLSADNLGDLLLDYGTSMGTVKTYIFYNGSLVIPYKIYSRPI